MCLVFEYMDSGLWELLHDKKIQLSVSHMKTYVQMLLKGVSYLHGKFIMHRVSIQQKEIFLNNCKHLNSILLFFKRYINYQKRKLFSYVSGFFMSNVTIVRNLAH